MGPASIAGGELWEGSPQPDVMPQTTTHRLRRADRAFLRRECGLLAREADKAPNPSLCPLAGKGRVRTSPTIRGDLSEVTQNQTDLWGRLRSGFRPHPRAEPRRLFRTGFESPGSVRMEVLPGSYTEMALQAVLQRGWFRVHTRDVGKSGT
jgi:hypothetical protein